MSLALQPPPDGDVIRSGRYEGGIIAMTVLAFCVVQLRMYTRIFMSRNTGWDDWIMFAASVNHLFPILTSPVWLQLPKPPPSPTVMDSRHKRKKMLKPHYSSSWSSQTRSSSTPTISAWVGTSTTCHLPTFPKPSNGSGPRSRRTSLPSTSCACPSGSSCCA